MESVSSPPFGAGLWDAARARWRVQVYGAGGARGRELVRALLTCGHPPARLALFGRSARTLRWRDEVLVQAPIPAQVPAGELAFVCTPPELSRLLAPRLAARGLRVIDLSGGLRGSPDSALVLAGCNLGVEGELDVELSAFTEQLALPLPSTALVAPVLALLERAVGLAEVDLFAVIAAAGAGAREVFALRAELCARAAAGGAPAFEAGARVGNLRPAEALHPGFEAELAAEIAALLGRDDLFLDVSAVAGDLERCDAFALKVLLHAPLAPEEAAELFAGSDALEAVAGGRAPSPAECAGSARIQVGRIRPGSRGPRSLCFSATGDQLRAGSSLAALRVAARLPVMG
jgi:aspartate-semialdehyde dehydrogenase